eukprot:m.108170 g.108170  ORF g.108170 m.108170 type:complete len:61 (+) comp37306_c1_seq37:2521-2703(+)
MNGAKKRIDVADKERERLPSESWNHLQEIQQFKQNLEDQSSTRHKTAYIIEQLINKMFIT